MLNEKNLGTTFYIQYDPSLLKKRERYMFICDKKATGNTTHCCQWWDSR